MTKLLLIPAVALFMSACGSTLSVSPLYNSENVIQDPNLVGTWTDEKGKDILVVRPGEDQAYDVLYTTMEDAASTVKFEVRLVQLNGARFLDIVRRTDGWTIPGHSFAAISLDNDHVKISFLDSKWLKEKLLGDETVKARPERGELLILMDNTESLQAMVARYANEPSASGDKLDLKRIYK